MPAVDLTVALLAIHNLQLHPFAFLVGFFDGGEDALVFQAVFEGGMDGFAFHTGVHEVGDGVDEGMLVANAVAGRPPVSDVGLDVVAFGDEDVAETAAVFGVVAVVVFQFVHVLEIEVEGAFIAVDFDFDMIFAAEGIAGGFEVGHDAVFHPAEEGGGVGHVHPAHFADAFDGLGEGAFGNEGMDESANLREFADEVTGEVNDVGIDIAVDAAAGGFFLEAPVNGEFRVGEAVLGVAGAEMENAAEGAFADHAFGQGDGGDAAIVMANHVDGAAFLRGGEHLLALFEVEAHGFFADDMFAVFEGGDGDLGMGNGGSGDIDDVNERGIDDFMPIGGGMQPAELGAGGGDVGVVAPADGVEFDVCLEGEEARRLTPGVGVRPSHETITNQTDAKSLRHIKLRVELGSPVFIVSSNERVNHAFYNRRNRTTHWRRGNWG